MTGKSESQAAGKPRKAAVTAPATELDEGSMSTVPAGAEVQDGSRGVSSGASFDFRRSNRIPKERLRALEAVCGTTADAVGAWLSGWLRFQLELRLEGLELVAYDELAARLPTPCCAFVYQLEDSGGQRGLVELDSALAFLLIDRLLGGVGEPGSASRVLTPLERLLVSKVADTIAGRLAAAWGEDLSLKPKLERFESDPELLRMASREDRMLVARFGLSSGAAGGARVCLPFAIVEPFLTRAAPQRVPSVLGSERDRAADRRAVEGALTRSRIAVSVRLPLFAASLRRLGSLAVGDVIETGLPATVPVEVAIGDRLRYHAKPGRVGGALAVRLLEQIATDSVDDRSRIPNPRNR
jgi:flagellar motor switch protein FliM